MKRVLLSLGFLAAVAAAQAHFVFAVVVDGSLQVGLEDSPGESHVPNVNGKGAKLEFWAPGKKSLTGKLGEDGYTRAPLGDSKVGGALIHYGVIERGGDVYFLDYYAKGAVDATAAGQKVGLGLELVLAKDSRGWYAEVLKDGKAVKEAACSVILPGSDEETESEMKDGRLRVSLTQPGRLVLRAMVETKTSGEADGKKYEKVRAYSTLVVNRVE